MLNMKWLGGATALVLVLTASLPVLAEDLTPADGWQRNFEAGLNILQSSYSSNWHGGEKGSIVWAARFDGQMEKQMSDLTNWRNTLKLVYGQTHNQNRDASGDLVWKRPDKSDDIIDFESLFRFTPDSWVDPFVALNFTSMFRDLTDPSGRTLNLNPMTFKETAGMARELINEDGRFMMTRLGFAFSQNVRATFVNAAPDEETSAEMTTEAGLEMVTEYKDVVLEEKVTWESKLTLALRGRRDRDGPGRVRHLRFARGYRRLHDDDQRRSRERLHHADHQSDLGETVRALAVQEVRQHGEAGGGRHRCADERRCGERCDPQIRPVQADPGAGVDLQVRLIALVVPLKMCLAGRLRPARYVSLSDTKKTVGSATLPQSQVPIPQRIGT